MNAALLLFALAAAPPLVTQSKGVATTYADRTVHGFTVHVDTRLLKGKPEDLAIGEQALAVLDAQLFQIVRRLRADPLEQLRAIPIWLNLDDPVTPCSCFHPSPMWLSENGFDAKKAKSVEIARAATFIQWTHEQPWMVLHELSHGFEDRVLRATPELGKELDALFAKAKTAGKYASVLHWSGEKSRHYALQNAGEYFAESSEAWLGTNDFYPFVSAELLEFDPPMAAFLKKVWGEPIDSRSVEAPR